MKRGKREHPKKERYIGIGHRNRADSVKIRGLEVVGKEEYTEVARSKGKGGRVDIGLISKGRKEEARLLKLELENDVMTDAERRDKTEKWKGLAYKREYWRMSPAQKKNVDVATRLVGVGGGEADAGWAVMAKRANDSGTTWERSPGVSSGCATGALRGVGEAVEASQKAGGMRAFDRACLLLGDRGADERKPTLERLRAGV